MRKKNTLRNYSQTSFLFINKYLCRSPVLPLRLLWSMKERKFPLCGSFMRRSRMKLSICKSPFFARGQNLKDVQKKNLSQDWSFNFFFFCSVHHFCIGLKFVSVMRFTMHTVIVVLCFHMEIFWVCFLFC